MEVGPKLSSLEALLNICANGTEILAIYVGGLVLVGWIPMVCGRVGYSSKITGAGFLFLVIGLATPGLLNFLVHTGDIGLFAGLIIGIILLLFSLVAAVIMFFLPTIFAIKHEKRAKMPIIVLNLLFLIPFTWLVAYIWACKIDKPLNPPLDDDS